MTIFQTINLFVYRSPFFCPLLNPPQLPLASLFIHRVRLLLQESFSSHSLLTLDFYTGTRIINVGKWHKYKSINNVSPIYIVSSTHLYTHMHLFWTRELMLYLCFFRLLLCPDFRWRLVALDADRGALSGALERVVTGGAHQQPALIKCYQLNSGAEDKLQPETNTHKTAA